MSVAADTAPSPTSPAAPHSAPGPLAVLRLIARDIKLAHSVFALPFAILGACLAGPFPSPSLGALRGFSARLVLIVICMVAARTWAMVVNRIADRDIDRQNQRTRRRVFATGELGPRQGKLTLLACAALFVATASLFWIFFSNPWPTYLALPVLALLAFYSFTKRFTFLCHLVLGLSLAASPIAAAIAINPDSLARHPSIFWLAGFVMLWVAGFDVIYALQDRDFDRAHSLRSIPAALGSHGAAWVSRLMHAAAFTCLCLAWNADTRLGSLFVVGLGIVAATLVWEHTIVHRLIRQSDADFNHEPPAMNMAFFTLNGAVSIIVAVFAVLDLVV